MAGASLTIQGGVLDNGTVSGGAAGGAGAGAGSAFGAGIFLQGDGSITVGAGQTVGETTTISGVIADQTGSGGSGAGSVVISGAGAVDLTATSTFTGGVTVDSGVLELANAAAAGSGGITFASTGGEIEYAAGANLANPISGFRGLDEIDFSQVGYATGDHAVADANGNVAIDMTSGQTVATFNVTGPYQSANLKVAADASDHIRITYVGVTTYLDVSNATDLSNDIKAIDFASQLDGGSGVNYVITLAKGATLTEQADIAAINLAGTDTLTINGQGAALNGAGAYRGLFAYSGSATIENLTR